jgi:hypothetical protein
MIEPTSFAETYLEVLLRMKRTLRRAAVALLTLALGITITRFFRSHPFVDQVSAPSAESLLAVRAPATANDESKHEQVAKQVDQFEAAYIDGDKLSYEGYDVERSSDAAERQSFATIKKQGRVIAILGNGGLGKESTRFGLFSLLGGTSKQLVILQYTGGAHCCWTYRIYDFHPNLHVIFDDESYGLDYLGYELHPRDIDGDGKFELTQAVMTFDYFHMSHASSVFPVAVFSYNEKAHTYVPANERFSAYVLEDIENDVKALESASRDVNTADVKNNEEYLSAVLRVLLKRLYAGDEADAWEFFNTEYRLSDKIEFKRDIRKALRHDPIYRSLYKR